MLCSAVLFAFFFVPGQYAVIHGADGIAPFDIKSASIEYNRATRFYEFEIKFTEYPDFHTTDDLGRQRHNFSCLVYLEKEEARRQKNVDRWIGGSNIHVDGRLALREATNGKYGGVLGTVSYTLSNKTMRFRIPAVWVGSSRFRYTLYATDHGRASGNYINASSTKSR